MGPKTRVNGPFGLLQLARENGTLRRGMERDGLITTKLFVAASFITFCVLAVALLGAAA
jgi:hypothetical protein